MINVAIAHASWAPGRNEALRRLLAQLAPLSPEPPSIVESTVKEHANVWARKLWARAARLDSFTWEQPCIGTLLLNDDVTVHPQILELIAGLSALAPDDVISLHSQFEGTAHAARDGYRLVKSYWPSGPAYFFPRGIATQLLVWLETTPSGWFGGDVNEDGVLAQYLWARQRPAVATIPALVRHDVDVPSTLGYDSHPGRQSKVDWDIFPARPWTAEELADAPYVPVPWITDQGLALIGRQLKGQVPPTSACAFCGGMPPVVASHQTGASLCRSCTTTIARRAIESGIV